MSSTRNQPDRFIHARNGDVDHFIVATGHSVQCDDCNREFTDSDEQGGATFHDPPFTIVINGYPLVITGDVSFCRQCADEAIRQGRKPLSVCPDDMTFADWVRDVLRSEQNAMVAALN